MSQSAARLVARSHPVGLAIPNPWTAEMVLF